MSKTYFNTSTSSGLYWYTNLGDKHLTLRLAGKPSFMLEKYENKLGKEEGQARYQEMLELLHDIGDNGKSPFVLYENAINK